MSKQGLKLNPLLYRRLLSSLNSNSAQNPKPLLLPHFCSSRQNPLCRRLSSSPPDNLHGLIDPEADSANLSAVAPEDFRFLSEQENKACVESESSNDAALFCARIKDTNDGFSVATLKFLRHFRGVLNEDLVIQVLRGLGNKEFCVKFFIWASRQIGYTHTSAVYYALVDVLEDEGNDRVPEEFLKEIKNDDGEVLGKLLNVIVMRCCRNGMWNLALEELGRLKELGYRPTRLTYNALIQVYLKADRLDTAYMVHREMCGNDFRMDEFTLGCFVYSLSKAGRFREALALIEKEEFVPDTVMYTRMISGLCEASHFEEAMDLLNRMRACSCIPNVVTYRILLCGCLNKRQLGRCKSVLSMMITEGCYPSPGIFNSLVQAYCKAGDFSYAHKLFKKMLTCGFTPGYVVYNILIGGICGREEVPSPEELKLSETAYNEMLDAGIVLNKVNVCNFARCLCSAGKFEDAYCLIREMMKKGFMPDTSTYSKVITYLCNAAKMEKAFLLFKEMKQNKVVPDVYTYTILIDNFCKAGLIQQARNLFNEMIRDGCPPNVVTFTALIHAYLKANKVDTASELFKIMLSENCMPNIVTYTALIDGYCKAGKIEKACNIYARMKGDEKISDVDVYFKVDGGSYKEPNVITYGALVDGLCKAYKVKEASDLIDTMSEGGCEPNRIVYDALIDGFCKVGKLDEAQEIFTRMSEHGYGPDVYTYSSLIDRLFKDQRLDLALKVLSKMLENSCAPNVVVYTVMVDGLCKLGKIDEAFKLMLMMEEKGCHPNVVTYTAMIDGFGKGGRVDRSLELFAQMGIKGCAPNFVTYRVLINHCCDAGLLDEAHKLLEEMKGTYWPLDTAASRKVIEGYSREFLSSIGLLAEIAQNPSFPVVVAPVYRLVIDNFCKAGKLEVALKLLEEISSSPYSIATQDMYYSLIKSLSLANKTEKAFELYAEMIKRGGIPDIDIFFHLINVLIQKGKWEEALLLSDGICQTVSISTGLLFKWQTSMEAGYQLGFSREGVKGTFAFAYNFFRLNLCMC
uniref:Pentatricopeptide repeat-containing protein n=1 Tax=Kalanchoe fedtschenkoi TaxID=63787 RepID=A0A7N0RC12_KALFE